MDLETAAQQVAKEIIQIQGQLRNWNPLETSRVLRNEQGFSIEESRIIMQRAREIVRESNEVHPHQTKG